MENKQFYNITGNVSPEEYTESLVLLKTLLDKGTFIKTMKSVYGYTQRYYTFNNEVYIITSKNDIINYIERVIYDI